MGISLTPETERLIEEKLKQGGYSTADDLVHAALGALEEMEFGPLSGETLAAIDRAEDQIERGEYRELSEVKAEWEAKLSGK
ncbi:MAG TPA: hypothetical protein VFE58_15660 [Tepidisphaeraceae bacterium]|jgi:Arc/MetJ-type ribon-helix-helix transcriptional regulator|nr:hypothetical protein [Tepidisphaeraceae bacterium]